MISQRPIDLIMVGKWEMVDYAHYRSLPVDRVDLFRDLVQLRMVHYEDGFRSCFDVLNRALYGRYFLESNYEQRRQMLSIWSLPSLNGVLAVSSLVVVQ